MLSIARSHLALPSQFAFLIVNAVALLLGLTYNHKTPELYANNTHSKIGWIITWIASAWVVMALIQVYTAHTKPHASDDDAAQPLNVANMAHYQRVQEAQLPQVSRYSNDSGQGTERNSASLYGHSRSPSVESEEQQFTGPTRRYTHDELDDFDDEPEKRGFLKDTAVDRFLSRNVARFAVGKPLKYLRFLYVVIERTILVQGFVAIMSGTVVYGGIGVSSFRSFKAMNGALTNSFSTVVPYSTSLPITSKAESFSDMASSPWVDGWVRSLILDGPGT